MTRRLLRKILDGHLRPGGKEADLARITSCGTGTRGGITGWISYRGAARVTIDQGTRSRARSNRRSAGAGGGECGRRMSWSRAWIQLVRLVGRRLLRVQKHNG